MTDLCLIQGREKFVSYWKRQKSPGCFHFVIVQQKSGLCQYKSMSPAHSCHTELTLFTADIKAFHFQILSNAHLWMGAECGKKPTSLLNYSRERQNCLNAAQHLCCDFHHWAAKPGVCNQLKSLKENALTTQAYANHEPEILHTPLDSSRLHRARLNCTAIYFRNVCLAAFLKVNATECLWNINKNSLQKSFQD